MDIPWKKISKTKKCWKLPTSGFSNSLNKRSSCWEARTYDEKSLVNAIIKDIIKIIKETKI